MPANPADETGLVAAHDVAMFGHDFEVGQTVAVIGKVVRVWPVEEGLPPAIQVRFMGSVQRQGGRYVPVPVEIVRSTPEDCPE